jgi:hypothetical protein
VRVGGGETRASEELPPRQPGTRSTDARLHPTCGHGPRSAGLVVAVVVLAIVSSLGTTVAARPTSASGVHWAWTELTRAPAPPPSAGGLLAYDSAANRFVEFGGWSGPTLNQTWAFDPATEVWMQLHPPSSPPVRADAAFVYDSVDGLCYLFGGWTQYPNGTYVRYGDTWSFSFESDRWTELFPTVSPSPRSDSAIVFDPTANEVVLVGGFSGTAYLGDEWTYSPPQETWTPFAPSGPAPSPRADGRMVFDPADETFLLFGGNDYSGPDFTFHHLNDTWSFSVSSWRWTEVLPSRAPPARDYAIQGFDTAQDWLLLTAGFGNRTILNDVWAFSPSNGTWWPLSVPHPPPPRYAGVGGFDPVDGRLIVSGGAGTAGLLNDTWSLGPGTNASPSAGPDGPSEVIVVIILVGGAVIAAVVGVRMRPPRLEGESTSRGL